MSGTPLMKLRNLPTDELREAFYNRKQFLVSNRVYESEARLLNAATDRSNSSGTIPSL